MSLLSTALVIIPALAGIACAISTRLTTEKISTISIGAIGGLGLVPLLLYGISLFTLVTATIAWTVSLLLLALSIALLWTHRHWWKEINTNKFSLAASILFLAIAFTLGSKLIFFENGTLATSIPNAWGDLGWHMANITAFAAGQSIPPENPIFAGARLTYPFLTNYYSGLLLRFGYNYAQAISVPTVIFFWLLLSLIFTFAKKTTNSSLAACVVIALFIGSGATLGGLRIMEDLSSHQDTLFHFITHLPRDYSGNGSDPNGYHFLNIILAGLLPQRALLMGMPIALALIILLIEGIKSNRPHSFLAAGILAGILPLAHAHTVIAILPAILLLCAYHLLREARKHRKRSVSISLWLIFTIASASVGTPSILYYLLGDSVGSGHFFTFDPGWTLAQNQNIAWFWFMNTGLIIPISLIPIFFKKTPSLIRIFAIAGLSTWTIANLFRFAPWAWDNYKLFVYWYIFTLPLLGWLAAKAVQNKWRTLLAPIAATLILLHSATGWLDIYRTALPTMPAWTDWSQEDIQFAQAIKENVPVGKPILTAPYHNHPAALAGRPVYLGYSAHVWSHGGNPAPREQAIPDFYSGHLTTLPEKTIDYIVVGPVERSRYMPVNIDPKWILVASTPQYQLYKISPGN